MAFQNYCALYFKTAVLHKKAFSGLVSLNLFNEHLRFFTNKSPSVNSEELFQDISVVNENSVPATALEECLEDVSHYAPQLAPSFNIAAYVNKSETLKQFLDLGVDLHHIEKKRGAPELILRLNFERDVKKYIRFLHDVGVSSADLGHFFTKNPFIFKQDLESLEVRINYLQSKAFKPESISRILTKNPSWLLFSTQEIDDRLGFFQQHFELTGNDVRFLATRMPKIITYNQRHIETLKFAVIEEMGFNNLESKQIILNKPKIYTMNRRNIVMRFDYIHNEMGIPHKLIAEQPSGLLSRVERTEQRHKFLNSLERAIYDPTKPGYISLTSLVSGTDIDFCRDIAKTPVTLYNKFLKTQ